MKSILALIAALALPAFAAPAPEAFPAPASEPVNNKRIVGGVKAQIGEYPYMVSLISGGEHYCGGSLLNAYTVITAASCSYDNDGTYGWGEVRAGSLERKSGGTLVNVTSRKIHPNFHLGSFHNDIALWHLETPIRAGENISFVKLPVQGSTPDVGTPATVPGWGYLDENDLGFPGLLRKINVPVVGVPECKRIYGPYDITDSMICAGVDGKGVCTSDYGGPLINRESKELLGLVSWGYGCAQPGYPWVYTRVGKFVNWINSNKWASV